MHCHGERAPHSGFSGVSPTMAAPQEGPGMTGTTGNS